MLFKDKRGISVIVGYVLLVSIVLFMSLIVYTWLKSYVPSEPIECPDGVSIYIQELSCEEISDAEILNFKLYNNGRFNIGGYFIRATSSAEQEVANLDIGGGCGAVGGEPVGITGSGEDENSFAVNDVSDLQECGGFKEDIYSIEITPIRYQKYENKLKVVSCGNAKVREICPQ